MEVTEHYDAGTYGSPRIDAQTEGVRVLDLIRSKEKGPDALPLAPAAEAVIDELEKLGDRLKLYRSFGTSWAELIPLTRPVSVVTRQRVETYDEAAMRQRHRQMKSGHSFGDWRNVNPGSLRRVIERETRQVPWLATIRERLAKATTRKGLDDPELVRLVIPRGLANDLFGCGPVRSWWEDQPEPFKLDGPGMYPPPELAGIRLHDADRWGDLLTTEPKPQAVVRVADLVQFVADRKGLRAVRPMAAAVLDALAGAAPGLYLVQQGELAAAVAPDHVWRRRFPSGKEHEERWQGGMRDQVFGVPAIELDEAEARGVEVAEDDRRRGSGGSWDREWPELPALTGAAGALQWARVAWVERARTFADLDAGDLGRLAVPLSWAVAKFGKPVQPVEEAATEQIQHEAPMHELPVQAPQPFAANSPATDGGAGAAAAAEELSTKRRQAVKRLRELEAAETKGARQKVADEFGIEVRTVGKWLKAVEDEESEARKSAALSRHWGT